MDVETERGMGALYEGGELLPSTFLTSRGSEDHVERGPWWYDGQVVVIKDYKQGNKLKRYLFNTMPIWVTFPTIKKNWRRAAVGIVASCVGILRKIDINSTCNMDLG